MSQFQFVEIKTDQQLKDAFVVLKELRPHLTFENFLKIYHEAQQEGQYTILGLFSEQRLVAIMGYRYLHDFVRGKHLYIDDLVTAENERSQGFGAQLLQKAEELSIQNGCSTLRLCTGVENESAKKFYERENWKFRAIVYTKKNEARK